ncbi:MAG: hypothetical protein LUG27_07380 [Clostridiales bacterium]|nr:hypothetical protein [Clostridiales bacterium]
MEGYIEESPEKEINPEAEKIRETEVTPWTERMQEAEQNSGIGRDRKTERQLKTEKRQRRNKLRKSARVYERTHEVKWEKLDNTAHVFPAIADASMSNVYRIAVYLDEDIIPEKLQEALGIVLPKFSIFNCRLRQGMFWYYFEENGNPPPAVTEESTYPCRYIEENRNRNYLFRVSYYKKRINLEVFHVLTDGTGGLYFLKELAYQYLRLAHPELRETYGDYLSSQTSLNTEDSYLQNFKKSRFSKGYKSGRSYILKGSFFPTGKAGIIHGHMPVDQVKEKAKSCGATINEYLVSMFIWSIYQSFLKGMPSKHPICVSVPVNLRPYFQSVTAKNFFVMVTASFHPEAENQPFEDVLESVKTTLREQLTKEHLEDVLSYNVTGERTMILRTIPLVFKNPGLKGIYKMHAKASAGTVTNLGNISVVPEYEPFIERFDVLLSRSSGQNTKMTLSTYRGVLSATIVSALKGTEQQRVFFRYLTSQGISVSIDTNGVYYE